MLTLYTVFTILVSIQIFFFNDTATTEIYTLSLHDALPICESVEAQAAREPTREVVGLELEPQSRGDEMRSEEHTSELQSQSNLVCRLLLEKKKKEVIISIYRLELRLVSMPHSHSSQICTHS